jgi:predicted metalloprotease with PDZ domain
MFYSNHTKINISMFTKGALIGMCIDIIIREKKWQKGILDLMQKLSMNLVLIKHLMTMNF